MSSYFKRKGGAVLIQMTNAPVNGLSHKVRLALMQDLERAISDKAPAVVLMGSGNHFSAGADIAEFARGGHRTSPSLTDVIDYMDAYSTPLVAGIHGTALGGGLETALACHWRVANDSAIVGLPEVKLGILPGAGGTQRLPRLTGVAAAVDIMTSGRMISPQEALSMGILDKLIASAKNQELLADAAVDFALSDTVQSTPVTQRRLSQLPVKGNDNGEELFRVLYDSVKKHAKGAVAPLSILKAVQAAYQSFPEGLRKEKELFEELVKGPQSKALQYFFFSERRVSTLPDDVLASQPKAAVPPPAAVAQAAVVGGGTMGRGIAMSFINAGIPVTLLEVSSEKAIAARAGIEQTYKSSSAYKSGKMSPAQVAKLVDLVSPTASYSDLSHADIVVEAGFEDMAVKKQIFAQLDKACKQDAILSTNTSYLDIDEIARSTARPTSVIGMHFFSPANIMQLLEVVRGPQTASAVIQSCMALGKKLKKTPVLAGNCFGFIGNRMLDPYIREAQLLVEEGASPAQVDRVMREQVGMAMGPFEMFDLAGIDVGVDVRRARTEALLAAHEEREKWEAANPDKVPRPRVVIDPNLSMTTPSGMYANEEQRKADEEAAKEAQAPPPKLDRPLVLSDWYSPLSEVLCKSGYLGQKSGRGFYLYNDPKQPRKGVDSPETMALIEEHRRGRGITPREISDQEVLERCVYPLVNEGFKVLEEGIALRPEDVDMVYVYGYGFPRHRGGPLFYAEHEVSLLKVYRGLTRYYKTSLQRPWLKPCELLESVVESGASLREEMYFRKSNKNKPTTPPAILR